MRTRWLGWLVCLLLVAGACSSGGTSPSGGHDAGRDAAVAGRDSGAGGLDAGFDASELFPDASFDAGGDAGGRHVPTRADMAGLVLNGTIPPGDVPAPDFTATAHTGEARTRADLLGHPTVMWFYPEAYTGG